LSRKKKEKKKRNSPNFLGKKTEKGRRWIDVKEKKGGVRNSLSTTKNVSTQINDFQAKKRERIEGKKTTTPIRDFQGNKKRRP